MTENARRAICEGTYEITPIDKVSLPADWGSDEGKSWLLKQAEAHKLPWLLAYADNGVIWGKITDQGLKVASDAFPREAGLPKLSDKTLQEVRLFGEAAELLAWRDGERKWHARLLRDSEGNESWYLDEAYMQWGDEPMLSAEGFTVVSDGAQGLVHAVPLAADQIAFDPTAPSPVTRWRPLRLGVRHYLVRNDDGRVTVIQSRLTGLSSVSRPDKEEPDGEAAEV